METTKVFQYGNSFDFIFWLDFRSVSYRIALILKLRLFHILFSAHGFHSLSLSHSYSLTLSLFFLHSPSQLYCSESWCLFHGDQKTGQISPTFKRDSISIYMIMTAEFLQMAARSDYIICQKKSHFQDNFCNKTIRSNNQCLSSSTHHTLTNILSDIITDIVKILNL